MAELDKLLAKFEAYALAHKLFSAGDKIIVAFSGGTDSTAMLYLLWKLRGKLNLTLLAVHINHQLRGDEAREDEDFAKAFCLKINVPIIVRKLEFNSRKDLENQARIKRFEAFRQIQKMYRFDTLALAHQKNDQAETILMNLFRGTGINGMGGIRPKSSQGIHPMLCFNADEVSRILVLAELEARLDSSNQLLVHNRNRIRQEFIPMIKKHFNPAFIEKISTQAEIFQKTEEF
ncbi:MAG: tRNA lysidine(34) synthetase TilS, partial [Candidatus Cloacimonetes bacterium]|nr:tRNA lysidine(34) synthetase TilS [Candidatus Cloacimonadota bacterium]